MNDRIVSFIKYHPVRTQRGLEILTGLVPWGVVAFVIFGSFTIPETVAYFVLAFNIYWLYRSLQTAINATIGYLNIRATQKVNWLEKLQKDSQTAEKYLKIRHVVIIPNVNEPLHLLERNIASLLAQNFPPKQTTVVLAMEERARQLDSVKAKTITHKYAKKFGDLLVTWHPLAPGETAGKHSNNTFAARSVKKFLVAQKRLNIKNITITTCDVDTVFHPQYFSLLTYKFLTSPKPFNNFYQAPLLMYNNLARLPIILRLPVIVGAIVFLATLQKPSGRFMNFSSYSLSLDLIDKIDYWDVDIIPEDWHANLKAFFHLKGDTKIIPLFVPVLMDAPESTTRWKTFKNTYETQKRWAWGVVDIPYVVKNFFLHPEIPFWEKFKKLSLTAEWHFTWSSSWFIITLGATIPTIINPVFARTALGYNLSRVSSGILTLCLVGLAGIILIDALIKPGKHTWLKSLLHPLTYLQWLLLPIAGLLFGALPGLESQTRLMLGKYLRYRVTEKV